MKCKLNEQIINDIENHAILLLLNCIQQEESRDGYRFNCNNAYYSEAFGIFRGLVILGYGHFGSDNLPETKENVKYWFNICCNKAVEIKDKIGIENAIKLYEQTCI